MGAWNWISRRPGGEDTELLTLEHPGVKHTLRNPGLPAVRTETQNSRPSGNSCRSVATRDRAEMVAADSKDPARSALPTAGGTRVYTSAPTRIPHKHPGENSAAGPPRSAPQPTLISQRVNSAPAPVNLVKTNSCLGPECGVVAAPGPGWGRRMGAPCLPWSGSGPPGTPETAQAVGAAGLQAGRLAKRPGPEVGQGARAEWPSQRCRRGRACNASRGERAPPWPTWQGLAFPWAKDRRQEQRE